MNDQLRISKRHSKADSILQRKRETNKQTKPYLYKTKRKKGKCVENVRGFAENDLVITVIICYCSQ